MCTNIKLNTEGQIFRTITKLEGKEPNENLELDKDSKTLTIKKTFINIDNVKIVNEWKFNSDRFYDYFDSFREIFTSEILKNDFFFNFPKNYRGCMVFLAEAHQSFLNTESCEFTLFVDACFRQIFKECIGTTFKVSVSFCQIRSDKFSDKLDYENPSYSEFKGITFVNNSREDTDIKGLNQIILKNEGEFIHAVQLAEKIERMHRQKGSLSRKKQVSEYTHEVITVRVIDDNKNFFSKYNFLLFKGYSILKEGYSLNTKGNFLLNAALYKQSYRNSKLTRLIQDTSLYNTFVFAVIPNSTQHIVLLHDILNGLKPRTASYGIDSSLDDSSLIKDFKNMKLDSFFKGQGEFSFVNSENKENSVHWLENSSNSNSKSVPFNQSYGLNRSSKQNGKSVEESASETDMSNKKCCELNIERLKKIPYKEQLRIILDAFEGNC